MFKVHLKGKNNQYFYVEIFTLPKTEHQISLNRNSMMALWLWSCARLRKYALSCVAIDHSQYKMDLFATSVVYIIKLNPYHDILDKNWTETTNYHHTSSYSGLQYHIWKQLLQHKYFLAQDENILRLNRYNDNNDFGFE